MNTDRNTYPKGDTMTIRATYRHLIDAPACSVDSVEVEVATIDGLTIRPCPTCGESMRCGANWSVEDEPELPRQTCCVCGRTVTQYVSRMIRWGARFHFCPEHVTAAPRYEIKSQFDGYWVGDAEERKVVSGPYYEDFQALEAATLWNAGETPSPLDMMLRDHRARKAAAK